MAGTSGIRAGRAFVELGVSDRLTAGLKKAQRQLQQFGSGVRSIGQKLTVASAAAATPLIASTAIFASFEQRMARVRALTGATGADFDRLANGAKRLGESTVFSASQAADAMSFFALAGYDVDQILQAIGPTLDLAAAGQLEIAQAADIAAKIMAGMGMEADELGHAVDVLTKAMTTANTDLQMLGDAMKFVGPIAKSAGLGLEQITAAVQLLSNAGIQGEMAGTTLRGAILALTSPSKEAADTLKQLGVSVVDTQGNVRPLADILDDINAGLAGLGSGARLDVLGRIFQARQAAGVAELLSQGGDKLRAYTSALQDAGGTASRIAGVQLNTLQGNVTILRSALEGLAIAVGESLVGPLRVVAHVAARITSRMAQWVRENRSLVLIIALAVTASLALGTALIAIGVAAQAAAFVVGGLVAILAFVKAALVGVAAVLGTLLSPIGLIVTAIAGMGTAFVIYSAAAGEAVEWLRKQLARLQGFVGKVVEGITDALAANDIALAAQILWLSLKQVWQEGMAALLKIWMQGKQSFMEILHSLWYGALALSEEVFHALEVAWIETTSFLSKTWTDFTSDLAAAWNLVQNWLAKRWLDLMGLFGQLTEEQVEAAKRMADEDLTIEVVDIENRRSGQLADRERRREQERKDAAALHEQTMAEIGRQYEEAQNDADVAAEQRLKETQQRLRETRRELDEAIAAARRKRDDLAVGDEAPDGPNLPTRLNRQIARISDNLAARISVSGTFNPLSVAGLGTGNAMDRTAKATEETAKNTKRIAETNTQPSFS